MTTEERKAALDAIADEIRVCDRCRLSVGRTNAVPGEGSPDTEVVMVGEGPGQHEDRQGRPFVGAAGSLLEGLLSSLGWRREDVFITNVVKCRPPGNRDPQPDEMEACRPFLRRQLEVLDPTLVVTLGRFSLETFRPGDRISRAHGTTRALDPAGDAPGAVGYAMYHPAAALRQSSLTAIMQRDMAGVPEALIRARAAREAVPVEVRPASGADAPVPVSGAAKAPVGPASLAPALGGLEPSVAGDQLGLF